MSEIVDGETPSQSKDDGGSASAGLSIRDHFAARAMHIAFTALANCGAGAFDADVLAVLSYQIADAMIKARAA